MTNLFIESIVWGLSSGIVGGVYRGILAEEEFFNPWFRWAQRFEGRWFFKPLVSCGHCTAGQIALWSYLFLKMIPADVDAIRLYGVKGAAAYIFPFKGLTSLFCLIIAISTAILVGKILCWYLDKKFQ